MNLFAVCYNKSGTQNCSWWESVVFFYSLKPSGEVVKGVFWLWYNYLLAFFSYGWLYNNISIIVLVFLALYFFWCWFIFSEAGFVDIKKTEYIEPLSSIIGGSGSVILMVIRSSITSLKRVLGMWNNFVVSLKMCLFVSLLLKRKTVSWWLFTSWEKWTGRWRKFHDDGWGEENIQAPRDCA